jgi:hypothetical protein
MRNMDLKHLLSRLLPFPRAAKPVGAIVGPTPPLDFDPFWHGDHWQNLLASPMDARHYVMEDWAASSSDKFETPSTASSKNRRASRRRT